MEENERWRPVREFAGLYEVSNLGRVRSVSRYVRIGSGERLVEGRILKPTIKAGYLSVCLCNGELQADRHVHRLVALAFIAGHGEEVRHLDGNPLNCEETNLAWGTHVENEADKIAHGTKVQGEKHGNAKINEAQVLEIKKLHGLGHSQLAIARAMKVGRGTVGKVVRGESWKHVEGSR